MNITYDKKKTFIFVRRCNSIDVQGTGMFDLMTFKDCSVTFDPDSCLCDCSIPNCPGLFNFIFSAHDLPSTKHIKSLQYGTVGTFHYCSNDGNLGPPSTLLHHNTSIYVGGPCELKGNFVYSLFCTARYRSVLQYVI